MDYILKKAELSDMEAFYDLLNQRIAWMDEIGIKQWNYTGYWIRYPKEYYVNNMEAGRLIILKKGEKLAAAGVIYEEDERWENSTAVKAYYMHHFASDLTEKGSGSIYLEMLEDYARKMGKTHLRLDCAVDSPNLNRYYGERGYEVCGTCKDGLYEGITREKIL